MGAKRVAIDLAATPIEVNSFNNAIDHLPIIAKHHFRNSLSAFLTMDSLTHKKFMLKH